MVTILQVFYSVFSGLLLSLAIPNEFYLLGLPIITLFALIPYYQAIKFSKNYKFAFLCGFCQAFSTHIASSFWLAYFKDFAAVTLGASAVGTGSFGGILGLLMYVPYASSKSKNELNTFSLSAKITENSCFKILYFAAVYTIYEWVKSSGFLGYPWGTISSAMYKWPLMMQITDITGIYGITFVFALVNACFGEYLHIWKLNIPELTQNCKKDIYIAASLSAVLFCSVFVYGLYQYNIERIPDRFISTIMVQQNSDPWKEKTDTESILTSEKLTTNCMEILNFEGKKPDLIVWSEGTLKNPLPKYEKRYSKSPAQRPLTEFIREVNTPLLTGGSWIRQTSTKGKLYFNSAILFDKEGNIRGHYAKNHLVPCAEAIPFMDYEPVREFFAKIIHISAGWTPGDQYVFFDIPCKWNPDRPVSTTEYIDVSQSYLKQLEKQEEPPTARISCPICFDDCFPDIMGKLFMNGSEVFMNLTDDSWSLKRSSEYQHFVNASYAAIEYRTTLVRSTNAGYSVVLDPTGKILADMPLFEEASISYDVPVYKRQITIYSKFGNWLPYILILLCGVYCYFQVKTFTPYDYIPSERKIKLKKSKNSKKSKKKNKK